METTIGKLKPGNTFHYPNSTEIYIVNVKNFMPNETLCEIQGKPGAIIIKNSEKVIKGSTIKNFHPNA